MFNTYTVFPGIHSNSIFLAYDNGQPFASLGHKVPALGSSRVTVPSAPPEDGQPRALISEYLLLNSLGGIGPWWKPKYEAGPNGKRNTMYRSDPRSQYTGISLNNPLATWNAAEVTFEGRRVSMLWNDQDRGHNRRATKLARQSDTVLPAPFTQSNITIRGDVYLLLSQMWKPCTDINTKNYARVSDFERVVRPLFKGWWRAISTRKGWRLYADDKNELFFAKLAIPV